MGSLSLNTLMEILLSLDRPLPGQPGTYDGVIGIIRDSSGSNVKRLLEMTYEELEFEFKLIARKLAECTGSSTFYDLPIRGLWRFHTSSQLFPTLETDGDARLGSRPESSWRLSVSTSNPHFPLVKRS